MWFSARVHEALQCFARASCTAPAMAADLPWNPRPQSARSPTVVRATRKHVFVARFAAVELACFALLHLAAADTVHAIHRERPTFARARPARREGAGPSHETHRCESERWKFRQWELRKWGHWPRRAVETHQRAQVPRPAQRTTAKEMTRAIGKQRRLSSWRAGQVAIAALEFGTVPRSTGREAAAMSKATTMKMACLMERTTRLSLKIRRC